MPDVDLNELERYLRIYQENPDSRVFAPLADMYRRLARYREAEQICREGLQRHPYYAGGKVALAYILLDTQRLTESFQEIDAVVTYYPDNLMARKILIRVLVGLGQRDKALREHAALMQLAPQLAGDPELERILKVASDNEASQGNFENLPRLEPAVKEPVRVIFEKTEPESSVLLDGDASLKLLKKKRLMRQKRVIEHWITRLDVNRAV